MFLKEERRKKLIATLMLPPLECPRDIAEKVSLIPDGEHDKHALGHAKMCAANAHENGSALYIGLSGACLTAIYEEAMERGMNGLDFIHTESFMRNFMAEKMSERSKVDLTNILTNITFN